jgi:hypothetical protein
MVHAVVVMGERPGKTRARNHTTVTSPRVWDKAASSPIAFKPLWTRAVHPPAPCGSRQTGSARRTVRTPCNPPHHPVRTAWGPMQHCPALAATTHAARTPPRTSRSLCSGRCRWRAALCGLQSCSGGACRGQNNGTVEAPAAPQLSVSYSMGRALHGKQIGRRNP